MPSIPLVGGRHYQELAPGVALDRAEIVGLDGVVDAPAGRFEGCLEVDETNPLEPKDASTKLYAPGVGLVADDTLRLARSSDGPA